MKLRKGVRTGAPPSRLRFGGRTFRYLNSYAAARGAKERANSRARALRSSGRNVHIITRFDYSARAFYYDLYDAKKGSTL